MKKMVAVFMLSTITTAYAEDQINVSDVEVVQVSFTLYRDKAHCDDARWNELVQPILKLQEKDTVEMEDAVEIIDAVTHSMRRVNRDSDKGIYGEISATLSDGTCSTRCGAHCPCKETRGVCFCSVKGTSCQEACGCSGEDPKDEGIIRGCDGGSCKKDDK